MGLPGGKLRRLMDGLAELYRAGPGDFPARAISVATSLASADSCSYNHFGDTGLMAVRVDPPDLDSFPDAVAVFGKHLREHPVLRHYQATGDPAARRISDFTSDRQFRNLALYQEFYRRRGTNYQLDIGVPVAGGLIVVALNRHQGDFSDEEAGLADLLRPHIARAAVIAGALSQPLPSPPPAPDGSPHLTARQASIVRLVAAGQADRQIARSLGISIRTVHAHLQNIYRALGVSSRTEALARLRPAERAVAAAGWDLVAELDVTSGRPPPRPALARLG